jgi:uroporphyrinogen decarboxylase
MRVTDHILVVGLESLRRGELYDTGIWIYDDMAWNRGPMFSPAQFERVFLPCYRKLVTAFKQAGAAKVVLHCDGNIEVLLDAFIEAGIDAINPVEPKAGMDLPELKRRYGRRLAYVGGMCNAHVLTRGTRQQIKAQVDRIKDAAQDGGVVIGTHSVGPDVPPENYHYYQTLVAAGL